MKTNLPISPPPAPAAPQATPQATPPPLHLSPSFAILTDLIQSSNAITPAQQKDLGACESEYLAVMAELDEHSHLAGRARYKAQKPGTAQTWATVANQDRLARRAIKDRASAISKRACAIAADVLETAAKNLPAYRARLLAAESAILGGVNLPDSPLKRMLDGLPAMIALHVKALRTAESPLCRPASILKFN